MERDGREMKRGSPEVAAQFVRASRKGMRPVTFGAGQAIGQLSLLDGGPLYGEPSSIIDLTGAEPVIVRRGSGDLSWLESGAPL